MATVKKNPKGMTNEEWKWEVESAARTMREYAKIKANPKLKKAAVDLLKKEQKETAKIIAAN